MRYLIPFNTKIIPYSSRKEVKGKTRLIPSNASFYSTDIIKVLRHIDPEERKFVEYYCLPMESNNSDFDSFLVSSEDVLED